MSTFADHVIQFNLSLDFKGKLPPGIQIMNPFREQGAIADVMQQFYKKFYNDHRTRRMILGINPGRLGSGSTGVPFSDTKRLADECGIHITGFKTHEPSSVFVYDVIHAYGGVQPFYQDFYIGSVCPLGFTADAANGKVVNYNYYDSKALTTAVYELIVTSIRRQLQFGIDRKVGYCMGTGKNAAFLQALNEKEGFFEQVIPLEHPRFVMQYKAKSKQEYVDKYLAAFEDHK
ncbi:SMUG2 DNA glycosylase family protein [Chitinophaga agrisoli]|uniref:SMUG2 DNA glycosylase family protein n=1 Tax=Chitinophaga agrisoli TaxID=2607653 RepID=A0A5B2VHQ9_9BACT|nr:uracil-DNA glycosylase family protein [Chitinophaga agrisoli]KAA2238435.1 SMUG2 DNA glycosylase family protein [Chitinophaga agrisoli]